MPYFLTVVPEKHTRSFRNSFSEGGVTKTAARWWTAVFCYPLALAFDEQSAGREKRMGRAIINYDCIVV